MSEIGIQKRIEINARKKAHLLFLMTGYGGTLDKLLLSILENARRKSLKLFGKPTIPDTFKSKIEKFEKCFKNGLIEYSKDFPALIQQLQNFDKEWIIIKHSLDGIGFDELTLCKIKDNTLHTFDQYRITKIEACFDKNRIELTEILNNKENRKLLLEF